MTRLRDIRRRAESYVREVGDDEGRLQQTKDLLLDHVFETRRLVNEGCSRDEVAEWSADLRRMLTAAVGSAKAEAVFTEEFRPPNLASVPFPIHPDDFVFVTSREAPLWRLQTELSQADLSATFDPLEWTR